jgi:hypothetical protein
MRKASSTFDANATVMAHGSERGDQMRPMKCVESNGVARRGRGSSKLLVAAFACVLLSGSGAVFARANDVFDVVSHDRAASRKRALVEAGAHLPPPPVATESQLRDSMAQDLPSRPTEQKANQSSLTRAQVVNLYNMLYVPGNTASMGWTGVVPPTCTPGTVSASYAGATLDRINFFRQISGLPTITFFLPTDTPALNAQASALMQGANPWDGSVSPHSPPTTWKCYTAGGASAAGSSNLAKGGVGPGAIDLYMDDFGGGNLQVGHRRWLLYPPFIRSASGDVPSSGTSPNNITSANDLVVFGSGTHGSRPAMPDGVAWPPGGFVPYQALPDVSNRWSFHWPGANFASASVSITKNGQPVSILNYDARDNSGFGDAAIVFRPNNIAANGPFVSYANPGAVDQAYVVTVSGITGGGAPSSVTYTVTVIDPAATPTVTISGSATLSTSGNVADATICANPPAGVSCSLANSGTYSCTVPSGWTGWLHLQAGNTKRAEARRFETAVTSVQSNQNFIAYDANANTSTFAFACNLDVDNNGRYEAAIDGAMLMRKLFGLSGSAQAIAEFGACAQRTSVADKAAFLDAHSLNAFDVNAIAGRDARPLLDGLVLVRLMLGVPAAQAVAGTDLNAANVLAEVNTKCGTSFP